MLQSFFCSLNVVCFLKYRARTNHFGNLLNNNDREQPEAHRSFICNSIQMFKKKKKKIVGDYIAAKLNCSHVLFCPCFSQ